MRSCNSQVVLVPLLQTFSVLFLELLHTWNRTTSQTAELNLRRRVHQSAHKKQPLAKLPPVPEALTTAVSLEAENLPLFFCSFRSVIKQPDLIINQMFQCQIISCVRNCKTYCSSRRKNWSLHDSVFWSLFVKHKDGLPLSVLLVTLVTGR